MKPVAIGIDHALDNIFADREVVARRKHISSIVPRFTFDLKQMDVSFELPMIKQGVRKFVQQRDMTITTRMFRIKDGFRAR